VNDPMPRPNPQSFMGQELKSLRDLDPGDCMNRMPLADMHRLEWEGEKRCPTDDPDIEEIARRCKELARSPAFTGGLATGLVHGVGRVREQFEYLSLEIQEAITGNPFERMAVHKETPDERIARERAEKQQNCRVKPVRNLGGRR
jgi:hypothetical protein